MRYVQTLDHPTQGRVPFYGANIKSKYNKVPLYFLKGGKLFGFFWDSLGSFFRIPVCLQLAAFGGYNPAFCMVFARSWKQILPNYLRFFTVFSSSVWYLQHFDASAFSFASYI